MYWFTDEAIHSTTIFGLYLCITIILSDATRGGVLQ